MEEKMANWINNYLCKMKKKGLNVMKPIEIKNNKK